MNVLELKIYPSGFSWIDYEKECIKKESLMKIIDPGSSIQTEFMLKYKMLVILLKEGFWFQKFYLFIIGSSWPFYAKM